MNIYLKALIYTVLFIIGFTLFIAIIFLLVDLIEYLCNEYPKVMEIIGIAIIIILAIVIIYIVILEMIK